jgi:phosphate acetyltransferase
MNAPHEKLIENVTFDELHPGRSAQLVRVLTLADIRAFAALSGDVNPAHIDEAYAKDTLFHGLIAHGMWGGALISGLLGTVFPGPGTIYIEQSLHFKRPVRVGDTLTVTATVVDMDPIKKHVTLNCEVHNQSGELTLGGVAKVLAPTEKVQRSQMALPELHMFDPLARLNAWVDSLRFADHERVRCAVVHPCDAESLDGAAQAARRGLFVPVLIGPRTKIHALADTARIDISGMEIEDVPHSHASAQRAAELAEAGAVQMLMKGSLHTDELMHAVLSRPSLRTARRVSHVFRFDIPTYPKPLLITDAAINISPSLEAKVDIVCNAIDVAHALGVAIPKVAILSAIETVTEKLASTIDAAALCKMADRGQIKGAILDGPLAFDNAISAEAAHVKGIKSTVAGDADILVVPDLEAGNMLAKQLEYLAGAASCGVVVGTRVPIALTSRADSAASRMASAALAVLLACADRPSTI